MGLKVLSSASSAMTGRTSQSANQDQDCCDAVSKRKFSTRIWLFPEDRPVYQEVGIGRSGASVEPASELFPGEARSRRAACCARSRVPGRRGGPDTRRWVVSGAMVGILRTPDSRGGGPSPYQEAPASARTYDWRRIDHTVRAIPIRSDFFRPRRRVRVVLPHKRRAIRGARPPIHHNFPTRFRPTARRAD